MTIPLNNIISYVEDVLLNREEGVFIVKTDKSGSGTGIGGFMNLGPLVGGFDEVDREEVGDFFNMGVSCYEFTKYRDGKLNIKAVE